MKRYSDSVADNTLLVSQNVTNLMNDIRAEDLLNDAVYYIDARDASASGQTIDNLGTAKELLPTTLGSSTSADSNDPQYLSWSGTNYVYLPGVASNFLRVDDAAPFRITGDIDIRVQVALDTWTPSTSNTLLSKIFGNAGNNSYEFRLAPTSGSNFLQFHYSSDGTNITIVNSTVAPSVAAGAVKWVRVTFDVDNGASGNTTTFFTSDDGTTWTQLGSAVVNSGTTSIFSSTTRVAIGSRTDTGGPAAGKFYRAQIFNGINGTKVLDIDTSVITAGSATSFNSVDSTPYAVTIFRSTSGRKTVAVTQPTWLFGTDDYMEVNNRYMSSGTYLYLPGIASNYASTPDAAALDIAGDIDVRVKVALDDWTPSVQSGFMSKWTPTGNQRSWRFSVVSNGSLQAEWSADGTSSSIAHTSSAVAGISDGTTKWIRWTLDVDNGASGYDSKFWTSDDGINWTQLGTTQTGVATTSIFASTAILEIGTSLSGGTHSRGKFFRAQVLNGIGGTVAFDANFETSITSLLQTSFTESSTNAATVTINRSGSTYLSAGITAAGYLYPGATNTFSASATDFLNFGASDSFTQISIARPWANSPAAGRFLNKGDSTGPRWSLFLNTSTQPGLGLNDGTNSGNVLGSSFVSGTLLNLTGVVNRSTQTSLIYTNAGSPNSVSITSVGSVSTVQPFRVGVTANGASYNDMEFIAAAIFRRALTSSEITLITNYFNRRSL